MNRIEVIGSMMVNPAEIEYVLGLAEFYYPGVREAEQLRGWRLTPAIPALYNWTVAHARLPRPDEGVKHLLEKADIGIDTRSKLIIGRARKLYMDFCREAHTMGLLQHCDLFGYVQWQKVLDLSYNVDFIASLLSRLQLSGDNQIAVQSAMRANWNKDLWTKIKEQRRHRRGAVEWEGKVYWLTNRTRVYAKKIRSCWLFGPGHVHDLAEEIRGDKEPGQTIAVQARLF